MCQGQFIESTGKIKKEERNITPNFGCNHAIFGIIK